MPRSSLVRKWRCPSTGLLVFDIVLVKVQDLQEVLRFFSGISINLRTVVAVMWTPKTKVERRIKARMEKAFIPGC